MTATQPLFWHFAPGAPFTPDVTLPPILCAVPAPEVSDDVLTASATRALRRTPEIADQNIACTATDGIIELSGSVAWHYQRAEAEHAVRYLRGATEVVNGIDVVPAASAAEVQQRIAKHFSESAEQEARALCVETRGTTVTISGSVASLEERQCAETAAWETPGVQCVINLLDVGGTRCIESDAS